MAALLKSPSEEQLRKYIKDQENFQIEGGNQKEYVGRIERLLEDMGYSVRIKTKGREATLLLPPLWAVNATLQAAHTLATWDPDWVIYKHVFGSKIEVKYFGRGA